MTNLRNCFVLLGTGLAALVGVGCTSADSELDAAEPDVTVSVTEAMPDESAAETTEVEVEANGDDQVWNDLGSYDLSNVPTRRIYVLVPPGLNDAELVEVVDELRARADADPASGEVEFVEHYLMDDDSQFDVLLAELPNTELGDSSNWPTDYVIGATVATSTAQLVPGDDGTVTREYWLCRFDSGCSEDDRLAVYDASS